MTPDERREQARIAAQSCASCGVNIRHAQRTHLIGMVGIVCTPCREDRFAHLGPLGPEPVTESLSEYRQRHALRLPSESSTSTATAGRIHGRAGYAPRHASDDYLSGYRQGAADLHNAQAERVEYPRITTWAERDGIRSTRVPCHTPEGLVRRVGCEHFND